MEKYDIATAEGLRIAEDALKYQIDHVLNGIVEPEFKDPKPETLWALQLLMSKIEFGKVDMYLDQFTTETGYNYDEWVVYDGEEFIGQAKHIGSLFGANKEMLEAVRKREDILSFERELNQLPFPETEIAEEDEGITEMDNDNPSTKLALTRDQVCLLFNLLMANNCIKRQKFEDLAAIVSQLTGFSEEKIRQNLGRDKKVHNKNVPLAVAEILRQIINELNPEG